MSVHGSLRVVGFRRQPTGEVSSSKKARGPEPGEFGVLHLAGAWRRFRRHARPERRARRFCLGLRGRRRRRRRQRRRTHLVDVQPHAYALVQFGDRRGWRFQPAERRGCDARRRVLQWRAELSGGSLFGVCVGPASIPAGLHVGQPHDARRLQMVLAVVVHDDRTRGGGVSFGRCSRRLDGLRHPHHSAHRNGRNSRGADPHRRHAHRPRSLRKSRFCRNGLRQRQYRRQERIIQCFQSNAGDRERRRFGLSIARLGQSKRRFHRTFGH